MNKILTSLIMIVFVAGAFAQTNPIATFENLNLSNQDTFWNGSDSSGGFITSTYYFPNKYNPKYKSWSGWSYSNQNDTQTAGYGNQYSVYGKAGVNGTSNFAVCSGSPIVRLPKKMAVTGMYVTNASYAAISMRDGDDFAKKFGGDDGNDPDWFKLTAYGFENGKIKDSTEMFLADFRSANNADDYILDEWTWFDLSSIGEVDSFQFGLTSTDVGKYGMNTPAAFCMDNFNGLYERFNVVGADFETFLTSKDTYYNGFDNMGGFLDGISYFPNKYNPTYKSWSGWSVSNKKDTTDGTYNNQYASVTGGGYKSDAYAVGFSNPEIHFAQRNVKFPFPIDISFGCRITNSYYAYHEMKNGSDFTKKFGGDDGNDPDYFRINIIAVDIDGSIIDTVTVYLADFRFADNSKDYILKDWIRVDLASLLSGETTSHLKFTFESSDTGKYGINTPQYFCMDDFFMFGGGSVKSNQISKINLYPNPAIDFIQLDIETEIKKVQILDVKGQLIPVSLHSNTLDVRNLKQGVYFIEISTDEGFSRGKFIKN